MTVINPGGQVASPLNLVTVAASPVLANKLAAGDANPTWQLNGDGSIRMGAGGASAPDLILLRSSASNLRVTNAAGATLFGCDSIGTGIFGQGAQAVFVGPQSGGAATSGLQLQGGEAGSNLYRSAAAIIATDATALRLATIGAGLRVAEGANAKQGVSAAMVAGAVTVANTSVTATSRIIVTRQDGGANPGAVYVSARIAGTSFTITSTNAADTGTVAYQIFEPA